MNKYVLYFLLIAAITLTALFSFNEATKNLKTKLVVYTPFTNASPSDGQFLNVLHGTCNEYSKIARRPDALKCETDSGFKMDPCFLSDDEKSVICKQTPWQTSAIYMDLPNNFNLNNIETHNHKHIIPWGIMWKDLRCMITGGIESDIDGMTTSSVCYRGNDIEEEVKIYISKHQLEIEDNEHNTDIPATAVDLYIYDNGRYKKITPDVIWY